MLRTFRAAAILAAMMPAAATAATIADTGTPTGTIRYTLAPSQDLAGQFTVGGATTITGVQGFIAPFSNSGTVTATLFGPGPVPNAGNVLFSTSFAVTGGEVWYGASGLNWAVAAGNYWLGFSTSASMGMRDGAPAPLGGYAFSSGNWSGNWARLDGLNIGIRVFGDPSGAIPEPGTWALLIFGFGAVGAGMRSRRRPRVAVGFAG